jgi:hypothetical protein
MKIERLSFALFSFHSSRRGSCLSRMRSFIAPLRSQDGDGPMQTPSEDLKKRTQAAHARRRAGENRAVEQVSTETPRCFELMCRPSGFTCGHLISCSPDHPFRRQFEKRTQFVATGMAEMPYVITRFAGPMAMISAPNVRFSEAAGWRGQEGNAQKTI